MFRIRFHGRGGQGIKTASRILGTAFFLAGYDIQDAPRYGAERRGAPMFGYVRADHSPILERGPISRPNLVVAVDETLLGLPAAAVFSGLTPQTILLVLTEKSGLTIKDQFPLVGEILTLDKNIFSSLVTSFPMDSCGCSAAAACLAGLSSSIFQQAMIQELSIKEPEFNSDELLMVEKIFSSIDGSSIQLRETVVEQEILEDDPDWIDIGFENATLSAPAIHGTATSLKMRTGDWRTRRPVIDHDICNGCRLCYTYCPDGVISLEPNGQPTIDYDHCKGCLLCLAQCPCKAIKAQLEHDKEIGDA